MRMKKISFFIPNLFYSTITIWNFTIKEIILNFVLQIEFVLLDEKINLSYKISLFKLNNKNKFLKKSIFRCRSGFGTKI